MICVVQPPPSANSGNVAAAELKVEPRSATGKDVSRNSERSLSTKRTAVRDTGKSEVIVNEPVNAGGPLNLKKAVQEFVENGNSRYCGA